MSDQAEQPIWQPSDEWIKSTNMFAFMQHINDIYGKSFSSYEELWQWSVTEISSFWKEVWDFIGIKNSQPYEQVIDDPSKMPGAKWFTGARLNFAENLLR